VIYGCLAEGATRVGAKRYIYKEDQRGAGMKTDVLEAVVAECVVYKSKAEVQIARLLDREGIAYRINTSIRWLWSIAVGCGSGTRGFLLVGVRDDYRVLRYEW
jgi:hypothetical protein